MDYVNDNSIDLSIEVEREVARTFMGRIEWEMILIGLGQFTIWVVTWILVVNGIIPLFVGFLIDFVVFGLFSYFACILTVLLRFSPPALSGAE